MITITVTTDTSTDLYNSLMAFLKTENIPFTQSPVLLQADVSGALVFLEQKLKDVTAAIQFDMDDNEYIRTCRKQEQIKSAIQLISELSAKCPVKLII